MQILLQATFGRPYIDVFETDNGDKDEATVRTQTGVFDEGGARGVSVKVPTSNCS